MNSGIFSPVWPCFCRWAQLIKACHSLLACMLALMVCVCVNPAHGGQSRPVTVFAAVSMKEALEEAVSQWRAESGYEAVLSLGGSSLLARQILLGAPADIFISASKQWMDEVANAGGIVPESRKSLASNRLVIISHQSELQKPDPEDKAELAKLLSKGNISMALVDVVPAGQYGKEALRSLGIWESAASRIVQADNVRAALNYVAAKEILFGIVYASDAVAEPRVSVVTVLPAQSHSPIRYPIAVTKRGDRTQTRSLLGFLASEKGKKILQKHGFISTTRENPER